MAIWGRKVSTPPTPAITPSTSRASTHGAVPAAARRERTPPANQPPIRASTPSASICPGPKVRANIHSIISRNTGMARTLWVTMASMRSDRVGAPQRAARPDALGHHGLDELVAGVGDQGLPVAQIIGPLILPADGLQLVPLPLRQAQGFLHQGVPLDELDRRPVGGDMGGVGLVVDQLAHLVMDLVGKAVVQITGSMVTPTCICRWAASSRV